MKPKNNKLDTSGSKDGANKKQKNEDTGSEATTEDALPNRYLNLQQTAGPLLFVGAAILAAILPQLCRFIYIESPDLSATEHHPDVRPQYVFSTDFDQSQLSNVVTVLELAGLRQAPEAIGGDWDLLWATKQDVFSSLQQTHSHQLVNVIPGADSLTAHCSSSPYHLRSFKLPADEQALKDFVLANPEKHLFQQDHQKRNKYLKLASEIDYHQEGSEVREFIADPLLVDGHMFDIGVYTVITSVDPLRLYIYKGDMQFRYYPDKYQPLDATTRSKIFVPEGYLSTMDMPAISRYYTQLGFGRQASFEAYMSSVRQNGSTIWEQVEDAIKLTVLENEPKMVQSSSRFPFKRSFFQLIRFDFVVDSRLKVSLFDVNLSPSLSSNHHKMDELLYQKILYNVLRLVGISSYIKRKSFDDLQPDAAETLSTLRNLVTNATLCTASPCNKSCAPESCQLCAPCLGSEALKILHAAYREYTHRGDMKRIFPPPAMDRHRVDYKRLSAKNAFMVNWFDAKCKADPAFC